MKKRKQGRNGKTVNRSIAVISILCLLIVAITAAMVITKEQALEKPEKLLLTYMNYISARKYEKMYQMIDPESSGNISQKDFITRNSKIYDGIEMENVRIKNLNVIKGTNKTIAVEYQTTFDTVAGRVEFENKVDFVKGKEGYALSWDDSLIHPDLEATDKVLVSTSQATRGKVLDRNGMVLAGEGTASSVGVIPGKLEDKQAALEQIAAILEMSPDAIQEKLAAKWVKEDSFVPVKTIAKVQEIELMKEQPDEEILKEKERQEQLLSIPGVMISDVSVREYPLKDAAAHLVGYVQSVTADDLEKYDGEGYHANSVMGKSGMEGLFEKELKGKDGCEIYIADEAGKKKVILADTIRQDGQDVQLTIDATVQSLLFDQFQEDKSCTVAMNPYTGEVLALISTPSFDNNNFVMGMSANEWASLNENSDKPMYNRFRQVWCPGSTFKPIMAAVGLETGAVNPDEDYGNVGLAWQKDASWGDYVVTTLHTYDPVILENALIYSDNIYFAKAALKIGAENLTASLEQLGFKQEMPFEIAVKASQYSNTETIESEVQLADSGYGQAEVLVNPVHLTSLYTAFLNNGNVIKPYLRYREDVKKDIWIQNAFSAETAERVLEGMKKVVNNPQGTGYLAHKEEIELAGKTGTAEIKASKDDTSGTELGWFTVFTTNPQTQSPILLVSMVEDVKEIGGSSYVVNKVKYMLDIYLRQ